MFIRAYFRNSVNVVQGAKVIKKSENEAPSFEKIENDKIYIHEFEDAYYRVVKYGEKVEVHRGSCLSKLSQENGQELIIFPDLEKVELSELLIFKKEEVKEIIEPIKEEIKVVLS